MNQWWTPGENDCTTRSTPGTQEDQTSPWLVIAGVQGCPGIARNFLAGADQWSVCPLIDDFFLVRRVTWIGHPRFPWLKDNQVGPLLQLWCINVCHNTTHSHPPSDVVSWLKGSFCCSFGNIIIKHPIHMTTYYVQPCVPFHVQWVKAYPELNLTWNWHADWPSLLSLLNFWWQTMHRPQKPLPVYALYLNGNDYF